MAELSEDDIETRLIPRAQWLEPVCHAADLPANAPEGALCFVEGDQDEIWQVLNGCWILVG